jgi:glycosyltransferase involved in cell wall biosynthesis
MYGLRADSDVGGEVYERMLLERLPARGIELLLGMPRDLEVPDPAPEWRIERLRAGRSLHWAAAPVSFAPWVAGLLRRGRVDLLRGHSVRYCGPSLLLARRLARTRAPVVLHHHHLSARWRALEARILAAADAVVTVSEHARIDLIDAGVPPARIHVVLQGVARPPRAETWEAAWPAEGLRLLALGRLEPRKRPGLALDALADVRRRGVAASLVVAGEGPLESELRTRAAALGIAGAVSFLGRIGDSDKWRLYDTAQALVFTSELEGFGVVVAEAQSRGLPVVVAAGTATAEAFAPDRSGLLAAADGPALGAALARLADDEVRRPMAEAAREFAARFDWDGCADQVADLYRELARGARVPAGLR